MINVIVATLGNHFLSATWSPKLAFGYMSYGQCTLATAGRIVLRLLVFRRTNEQTDKLVRPVFRQTDDRKYEKFQSYKNKKTQLSLEKKRCSL